MALELGDLLLGDRSGHVACRFGKGRKQRSVPLPLPGRRAIQSYLEADPRYRIIKFFLMSVDRSANGASGRFATSTAP